MGEPILSRPVRWALLLSELETETLREMILKTETSPRGGAVSAHARTMEEMVVLNLGSSSTTATLSNAAGGSS